MNKILLDTNAYSNLLRGDEKIFEIIGQANEIIMSVVVIGELLTGFKGGKFENQNEALLKKFLHKPTVTTYNINLETAAIFASIKHRLKSIGEPIPMNDVWIAAHGIETSAMVISYDKHFKAVEGLEIWDQT